MNQMKSNARNGDGHHQVLDLMTKVHELCNDIECFCKGEDDIQNVEPDLQVMKVRGDEHTHNQFHNSDRQQQPECAPDSCFVKSVSVSIRV